MSILNAPWHVRFKAEMEAIGCKFPNGMSLFGDDQIEVPRDRMDEARVIIIKYSCHKERAK